MKFLNLALLAVGVSAFNEQVHFGSDIVKFGANAAEDALTDFKVGKYSLLSLHKQLIDINSISNTEGEVSVFLLEYLKELGFTVELDKIEDAFEERYNVYAYHGKKRDATVLLTSHIDTVPPYFGYRVEGSKIYGRGSSDAKASVAAQVGAYVSLLKEGSISEGDVALLFVVGEEISGVGMGHASEHVKAKWDVAIFGEPTELKLGVGHKGGYIFTLVANGKASHSGYPQLGRSATEILIPVLNELLNVKWPESELLGPSTLNIGSLSGGVALNVIPAFATARAFVRVASDIDEIDRLVHEIVDKVPYLDFELNAAGSEVYLDYKVPGFDSIVLAYGTDVPHLNVTLKLRYLYGPGSIQVAHSATEYVENSDLLEAIDGYKKLVKYNL